MPQSYLVHLSNNQIDDGTNVKKAASKQFHHDSDKGELLAWLEFHQIKTARWIRTTGGQFF
jgi:hypothetical protein